MNALYGLVRCTLEITSVIEQKGETQNKARQIFRKTNISYPLIRTRSRFFRKFDVL